MIHGLQPGAQLFTNNPEVVYSIYVTSDGAIAGGDFLTPKISRQIAKLQRKLARKLEALRKANGIAPGGSLRDIRFGANIRKILAKLRALHAKVLVVGAPRQGPISTPIAPQ